jgi:hypothetical protein
MRASKPLLSIKLRSYLLPPNQGPPGHAWGILPISNCARCGDQHIDSEGYQKAHKYYSKVSLFQSAPEGEDGIAPKGPSLATFASVLNQILQTTYSNTHRMCRDDAFLFLPLSAKPGHISVTRELKTEGSIRYLKPSMVVLSDEKYPSRSSRLYIDKRQS